jgi:LacI family transcriptional regulator
MRITISEIARMAGVSKTTVSRVINNKPDVDERTRERILTLIAKYDFQPNALAKAIMLQKSNHIGLLIPPEAKDVFSHPFYTEVMHGVSIEVDQRGYFLLICYAQAINYLDIYRQKRVDGFILLSPGAYHREIIETLVKEKIPFISTSKISEEESIVSVDIENYHGAMLVMDHLVSLGHKKIAYIGMTTLTSGLDRLQGYKDALSKYNLPYDDNLVMISDTEDTKNGYIFTKRLLDREKKPTAIFATDDIMAIGSIKAIIETGLKVPEDISVVGFDDILLAKDIIPSLTTIHQPAYEKGVNAARLLINFLESNQSPKSMTMDIELVVRKSTASPPKISK